MASICMFCKEWNWSTSGVCNQNVTLELVKHHFLYRSDVGILFALCRCNQRSPCPTGLAHSSANRCQLQLFHLLLTDWLFVVHGFLLSVKSAYMCVVWSLEASSCGMIYIANRWPNKLVWLHYFTPWLNVRTKFSVSCNRQLRTRASYVETEPWVSFTAFCTVRTLSRDYIGILRAFLEKHIALSPSNNSLVLVLHAIYIIIWLDIWNENISRILISRVAPAFFIRKGPLTYLFQICVQIIIIILHCLSGRI